MGANVKWLADTGAVCTVMDKRIFRRLPQKWRIKRKKVQNLTLSGATGHNLKIINEVALPFTIQGKTKTYPVLIVEGLRTGAILGMDIMKGEKFVIDTHTGRVSQNCESDEIDNNETHCTKEFLPDTKDTRESGELLLTKQQVFPPYSVTPIKVRCEGRNNRGTNNLLCEAVDINSHINIIDSVVDQIDQEHPTVFVVNSGHTEARLPRSTLIGKWSKVEDFGEIGELLTSQKNFSRAQTLPSVEKLQFIRDNVQLKVPSTHLQSYMDLICQFHDVFSEGPYDLGRCGTVQHKIQLRTKEPVFARQFPIPWQHEFLVKKYVDELLRKGCIQRSTSNYNSPIFCVRKPHAEEGAPPSAQWRVVQDFRKLNLVTLPDNYVIKSVQDCINSIGKRESKVFSTLDLTSGFWQQELDRASRPLTAFSVPGRGTFEWCTMPMGLQGASASFARLMDFVLQDLPGTLTYIDDLMVNSPTHKQHLSDLQACFTRLRQHNLKLNLRKCRFGTDTVNYLGYTLSPEGIKPGLEKTKAVEQFPPPTTVKAIREFTGLANYFRHMIKNYSKIASHLTTLTSKKANWKGGELPPKAMEAFNILKRALCSEPLLAYPTNQRGFILSVDAATGKAGDKEGGLGAILSQKDSQGKERVIAYASRSLKEHEQNYGAYLLEMQAAVWAIEHFDVFLKGSKFVLRTDHRPLEKLSAMHTKTLNRLQQIMSEYDFMIRYRPGEENTGPDALSRNPIDALQASASGALGMTLEQLRQSQKTDSLIRDMYRYAKYGDFPEDRATTKLLKTLGSQILLQDDMIYLESTRKGIPQSAVWVVPAHLRQPIIRAAHTSQFAGHGGTFKTLTRINTRYWWPGLPKDVDIFVRRCQTC